MKLKDVFDNYRYLSAKAGDIARQLGLVGIALVWIFRVEQGGQRFIPNELAFAAVLFILGLAADLLQYVVAYRKWEDFADKKEIELQEKRKKGELEHRTIMEVEFEAPANINEPAKWFVRAKLMLIIGGYVPLLWYLLTNVGSD